MADVSDGCLMHVCLKVEAETVRAANPEKQYKLLAKVVKTHNENVMMQEMQESARVDAAEKQIYDLAKIGLRALLSMKLPDLNEPNLELRILLCNKEADRSNNTESAP